MVYFAPPAPHEPAIPEPKYKNMFSHLPPWRPASYNEADMSDKPSFMRRVPPISPHYAATIDAFRKNQLRTLQSVDQSVGEIVSALQAKGELENTMIIYTSDNGMLWGEHRLKGKGIGYEEAIRVPMVVRYDALIPKARTDDHLVAGFDITPTAVQLAGVTGMSFEGQSLVPLLRGDPHPQWRHDLLIEHWAQHRGARPPTMCMVRSERFAYMHYFWGNEDELYDLSKDPLELQNEINNPAYANDLSQLKRREQELCQPPPPGTPKIPIP
jgi:arylsulfatase A-like enzyme